MNQTLLKFFAIIVIFFGEALAIYAELFAAKTYSLQNKVVLAVVIKTLIIMLTGSVLLIVGYVGGLKVFKNIWVVSVISITSILILEPILNIAVFHEWPTKGAGIGFVFGVLGLIASLF